MLLWGEEDEEEDFGGNGLETLESKANIGETKQKIIFGQKI